VRKYEMMLVLKPELDDEAVSGVIQRFTDTVRELGGNAQEPEKWGKRKLAYEIAHYSEGFYVVLQFEAEPNVPHELDRMARISEDILRHLLVSKEEE